MLRISRTTTRPCSTTRNATRCSCHFEIGICSDLSKPTNQLCRHLSFATYFDNNSACRNYATKLVVRKGIKNFAASTQSYVLLHGVEERENDILIPLDKHSPREPMHRADRFFGLWPISLGERREGRLNNAKC